MIRVVIADDHRIFRQGLHALVCGDRDLTVVGEAGDGHEAVRLARELRPDVVVMDLAMPGGSGLDATRVITGEHPAIRVVVLSIHADRRFVRAAFEAGACGYLLKDCAFGELAEAVRSASPERPFLGAGLAVEVLEPEAAERTALTPREREVLQLLVVGSSTREVADCLGVSVKTAETHRANVLRKVGVRNVPELVRYAIREGLTEA